MSWFSEIAGKAEDLLNKVDQTAATALQNKSKSSSYTNINRIQTNTEPTYETYYNQSSAYVNSTHSSSTTFSPPSNEKPRNSSRILTPRKKPESDDEKLLKFLNCDEALPTPPRKIKSNVKPNSNKQIQNLVVAGSEVIKKDEEMLEKNNENVVKPIDELVSSSQNSKSESELQETKSEINQDPPPSTTSISSKPMDTTPSNINEELILANKRAEHAEAEMKRMQKKLEHWNSLISGNDRLVRELQEREKDMVAAMDAKDSQLAILKVRLEEADRELNAKITILEELKTENQRIIKENAEGASFQNKTLESLREQIQKTEIELNKTKDALHLAQTEHMQTMDRLKEEHRHLSESYTTLQKNWYDLNEKNKEVSLHLKNANKNLDSLQQEYNDYKQKAQRILQSKEKLIASLKEGNFEIENTEKIEATASLLNAEVEAIKQEKELLKEELRRANELTENYRAEIQELEKLAHNDLNTSQERCRVLKEQLEMEKIQKEETVLINNQLKEEIQLLREDLTCTKSNFQSRLQDREIEIEKLRRQLTAKSLSTVSQDELESRLHALTENLIQKQTLVEALSTEKNSLVLQLERLEQQLKEAQQFENQHHTFVRVSHENEQKNKPMFVENPFDSSLTKKVKKVYGSIDAFSIRLGVFFRRYPITRVFLIIYMLLLHFWVMIVLLTYEPEVHNYVVKQ